MSDLVFVLPTCEPDEMFKHLYPSLHYLKTGKNFIKFAICFQPPYTNEEIDKVIKELDNLEIPYKYIVKDYEVIRPYTPLLQMRNDCAMLYPNADYYALLDDDMSFTDESCVKYLKVCVDRLDEDPDLSVIALNDYPRSYENFFATNNGIIYRGGKYYGFEGLVPHSLKAFGNIHTTIPYEGEDLLKLFGGFQDKFCAMMRLCNGSKCDQLSYFPSKHVENRKERGAYGHGWDSAKYQQGSVSQFIIKYLNKYFLTLYSM